MNSIDIVVAWPGCTFTETEILAGLALACWLVSLVSEVYLSRINLRLFSLKDGGCQNSTEFKYASHIARREFT